MTKRNLRRVRRIGVFTLNAAALVYTTASAVFALRENNAKSGELYQSLQAADTAGVGVEEALIALQTHVNTHMNASPLPQLGDNAPVQLSQSYQRAKIAEQARATSERERVNAEAIAYCEAQFGRSNLVTRTQCVADYSTAHPVQSEREPVADLYRYDFISPMWTPDRAGWLIVVSVILATTLVLQVATRLVARIFIKQ